MGLVTRRSRPSCRTCSGHGQAPACGECGRKPRRGVTPPWKLAPELLADLRARAAAEDVPAAELAARYLRAGLDAATAPAPEGG